MSPHGRRRPPNTLLANARRRMRSPSGSGRPMSRQELAEAVNAYLWRTYEVEERLDENDIGKLERGEHRWPGEHRREALRAVLGVDSDAALGFYIVRATPAVSGVLEVVGTSDMLSRPPGSADCDAEVYDRRQGSLTAGSL